MSLEHPLILGLLLLPLFARRLLPPVAAPTGALHVPPAIAAGLRPGRAARHRSRLLQLLGWLVWACLLLALAGPRAMETHDLRLASGRDIILALDLSGSMETEDFDLDGQRVSRLDAVKQVAAGFIEGREGDRVGLVVFGDRAFVAAPLTHDTASVARAVLGATIGISGKSTAISDGLGLALRRLRGSEATSRVVILLSDGVDTTGTVAPRDVATMAQELGIRVHTIALGPDDLESRPAARDAVDAATLREVAELSGGEMFRVRGMDALRQVTRAIDALEPSPASAPPLQVWRDYWTWPAGAALALSLLALGLTRRGAQ
ncbi:VWA domain-containing protein [Poseidonocella sedimentorum]|uniref:Ca-activated chloride channel family protein n=1 Tax=Poseidonocella sedimentorum TaxID=871652 RepID=A0A1I6E465_9RHOB|nr:VWA domain-containing protein [Poseidonocella sedimentorum]SFR12341.1 Ca-activated chloride channel family protein [Poseidonocella sedimentorum]